MIDVNTIEPSGLASSQPPVFPSAAELHPAVSLSFWVRLFRRSKPYLLPLAVIDAAIVYAFSLHLSFVAAARSMIEALDRVHAGDPRGSQFLSDAQALVWKSLLALGASAAGALICITAFVLLCWSARCHRRRKRMATEISATLHKEGGETPLTIVDLSTEGCRVKPASALEGASSVRLAISGRPAVSARVVWVRDGLAGLQFSAETNPRQASRSPAARRPIQPQPNGATLVPKFTDSKTVPARRVRSVWRRI